MTALGLDGCRAGWIGILWGEGAEARLFPRFADALAAPARRVAVDVPVGLLDAPSPGGRACDREARALLGPRARSVFSPPCRAHLGASRFADARGLSLQAFHLLPRIREADDALSPRLQARVREAHPELAFARLAGAPMRHAKRSAEGRRERWRALRRAPGDPFAPLRRWRRPPGVAEDDLLDACVLAWTARRMLRGEAARVPRRPGVDARGLRMEIWS